MFMSVNVQTWMLRCSYFHRLTLQGSRTHDIQCAVARTDLTGITDWLLLLDKTRSVPPEGWAMLRRSLTHRNSHHTHCDWTLCSAHATLDQSDACALLFRWLLVTGTGCYCVVTEYWPFHEIDFVFRDVWNAGGCITISVQLQSNHFV